MRVRAVLFDLGYTLLDYPLQGTWGEFLRGRLEEMYAAVCEVAGNAALSASEFAASAAEVIGGEKARAIERNGRSWHFINRLREALGAVGMTSDDDGLERLMEVFLDPIRARARPYPDTHGTLERLHAAGMRLGIISNSPWDTPGRLSRGDMARCGIEGYFRATVVSGDVPWRKPNPEFMLAAARKLGVGPEECLVVGDSLRADIGGARAAGMRAVWINRAGAPVPKEAPLPDHTLGDLRGVAHLAAEG